MKLLFITLSNTGDAILTLPVLGVLLRSFPKSEVTVLAGPRVKSVFEADPRIKELFVYDKRSRISEKLSLIKQLRARRFDIAIDLRNSMIPFFVAAKRNPTLFSKTPKGVSHKKQVHLSRISSLGFKTKDASFEVYIGAGEQDFVDRIINQAGKDYIVVAPGARSHIKRWKKEGFADVCRRVADELGMKIIMLGDEDDAKITGEIKSLITEKILDLAGKTTIRQAAAVLKSAKCLLTNDSALLHLGCNVGVPVVAIFGPTDPRKYGPTGKYDIVVRQNMKCSPCEKAQCKIGSLACMNTLSVDVVYNAVRNILERKA